MRYSKRDNLKAIAANPLRRNTTQWLEKTLEQGVVFVPGEFFFPERPDYATLRFSFATATDE